MYVPHNTNEHMRSINCPCLFRVVDIFCTCRFSTVVVMEDDRPPTYDEVVTDATASSTRGKKAEKEEKDPPPPSFEDQERY